MSAFYKTYPKEHNLELAGQYLKNSIVSGNTDKNGRPRNESKFKIFRDRLTYWFSNASKQPIILEQIKENVTSDKQLSSAHRVRLSEEDFSF